MTKPFVARLLLFFGVFFVLLGLLGGVVSLLVIVLVQGKDSTLVSVFPLCGMVLTAGLALWGQAAMLDLLHAVARNTATGNGLVTAKD